LRKDPGINGWVSVQSRTGSCGWFPSGSSLTVTSRGTAATPDGAPFGLYLYDTEDITAVSGASITLWVLGDHASQGSTAITWTSGSGHSNSWRFVGRIGTATKPDGLLYTGYRWTYDGTIDPRRVTTSGDGVRRVFLGDFVVSSNSFQQPSGHCGRLNYWTERSVVIDGQTLTFERRAGTDGAYAPARRSARSLGAPEAEAGTEDVEVITAVC
jgi:hypothetical protein